MAWKKTSWGEALSRPTGKGESAPSGACGRRHLPSGLLAVVFLAVAVLVAALAWMRLAEPAPRGIRSSPETAGASRRPNAVMQPARKPPAEPVAPKAKVQADGPKAASAGAFAKAPGQMQLPDGRVLRFRPPREGEHRIVHSHGRTYRCDHLGNWEDVTPKPVFDNAFEENLIGLSVDGGYFMPGMLTGLDPKGVMEMLKREVVVNPGDPDDVVEKKRAVAAAKETILEYIRQGGTFDQFVMEMRDLTVQERKVKSAAMKDIVGLLKEGRAEEAAAYRRALDEQLKKEGLAPVRLPAHIIEILGQAEGRQGAQEGGAR